MPEDCADGEVVTVSELGKGGIESEGKLGFEWKTSRPLTLFSVSCPSTQLT